MSRNQFKPIEADNKTIFTNQNNETIDAVIHQFALTKEGKYMNFYFISPRRKDSQSTPSYRSMSFL